MKCGAQSPPTSNFCGKCGAPFDAAPSRADVEPSDRGLTGERRHLTLLFCDLVNSTGIATQLDPEEWREIVADYHRTAAQAIERFGGHVAQSFGDGVMAYFGWPQAHDNNAERAVRAGLAIIDALSKLNKHTTRPKLSVRVGIDSGPVVVGRDPGKSAEVFGDTPNIAARVQAAAEPGSVLITGTVQRLISGLFVVEDRGAQVLKGIERPVQLYQVIQHSGVRQRLEAIAATEGLAPFVGRNDELGLLMDRWERVLDGKGQVVLISGEPGIGKSRLLRRFRQLITGTAYNWVEAAASPFFQHTPFYPVADVVRELLARYGDKLDQIGESLRQQRIRGQTSLTKAGGSNGHSASRALANGEQQPQLESGLELSLSLIAQLLNLSKPMDDPSPLASGHQRRRLLSSLVEWVLGAAQLVPVVIAIEDLHWADASTLELIQLLVERGETVPLLLVSTARSEFPAQWPLRTHHTQIILSPLNTYSARTMVETLAGQKTLPEQAITTVVERAGGVPLFVEELTRVVLESGNLRPLGRDIPATLHDSLMARLDRLGPAKEVIQLSAVIGSEFSFELLHAVHPIAEEALQSTLGCLIDEALLYVRGLAPEATYQFKHALIRDAAYEALLKSRRRELHRLVAHTIDDRFPDIKDTQPEVLARHWAEAGETEQAISQWSRAGRKAEGRSAFTEAQKSYQQALDLLQVLPESAERDHRELEFRQSIFTALQITKGWAAPETLNATERAASLAEKSGNLTHFGNSVATQCFTAWVAGDLSTAGALADQALELALRENNPTILAFRYLLQLMVRHSRGDLAGAEQYFTRGVEFFEAPGFRQARVGASVAAFYYGSHTAWTLGLADTARKRLSQMMAAVNGNNPHDLAIAGHFAASLRVSMGEYEQAAALAGQALDVSEKNKFPNEAAMERIILGHAWTRLDRVAEGIVLMQQGIAGVRESGQRITTSIYDAWLAEAQGRAGFLTAALETIEQALREDFEEPVLRPEVLRIRGELRVKQGQTELADADFRMAIALARTMGAKAWELRARTSLARLLRDTSRRDEARTMLGEIYGWFTEGFDTADLIDAKTLLDQLGRKP